MGKRPGFGVGRLVFILLSLWIPTGAHAFQVTCASQGYWTGQAINEMQRLQGVLTELRDDPNCKGIESVVLQMESARQIMTAHNLPYGKNTDRFMNLPGEIASLYTYVQTAGAGSLVEGARSLLVNKILGLAAARNNVGVEAPGDDTATGGDESHPSSPVAESQLSWQAMEERTRSTAITGMTMMQRVFEVLPNYEQCVSNRPDQGLALVSAGVTMFAAFASGEQGATNELGRTLASLVTFLRNYRFGVAIGKLKRMEYWSNLSCLLESANNVYCNVQDSYALLQYQNPGYGFRPPPVDAPAGDAILNSEEGRRMSNPDHPLHGYYIMVREIPTISRWLQEVQFGIEPKMKQDADFKNATLTTMTNFLAAINNVKAIFNEKMVIYQRTSDKSARRNQLFALLRDIVDNQLLGRMGEENFFVMAVPERKLPFYLVGYDAVPTEVLPNQYRERSANWADWMENGGLYRKEWDDPDALLNIFRSNLWQLMDNASELGSNWFRLRFNVDPINLVSRSVTDPNITAVESLISIYGYLGRLAERLSHDTGRNYVVLPDVIDTIDRIQKVLGQFQEMRKLTQKFFPGVTDSKELGLRIARLAPEEKKKIAETAGEILTTAYIQFNIILQRDTFLANRLNTLVMYDYSDRVRRKDGMNDYVHDLLVVTGRTLMDRLIAAQGTNPNQMKSDLDAAGSLMGTNFEVMEEMFGDDFEYYLNELVRKGGGMTFVPGGFMSPGQFVKVEGDDNAQHSYDQIKSRICLQTLQFKNFKRYRNYCYETTLRSQFDESAYYVPPRVKYGLEAIWDAMVNLGPATSRMMTEARKLEAADGRAGDGVAQNLRTVGRALLDQKVMDNVLRREPFHLSVVYEQAVKERWQTYRKTGWAQMCMIRDFLRRNEVFWITKQFEEQQQDRFIQIQELEKHWADLEQEERRKQSMESAAPVSEDDASPTDTEPGPTFPLEEPADDGGGEPALPPSSVPDAGEPSDLKPAEKPAEPPRAEAKPGRKLEDQKKPYPDQF